MTIHYEVMWGGPSAAVALSTSGMLPLVNFDGLPLCISDVLTICKLETGFLVMAYEEGSPIGYAVGQMYKAHRGEKHFHLSQVWVHPEHRGMDWMEDGMVFLEELARMYGCTHMAATTPNGVTRLVRRYGFIPIGTYVTKRIDNVTH